MKSLQNQYKLITEGKGEKDVFLKEAKRLYPNLLTNSSNFKEAETILKNKGVISENIVSIPAIGSLKDESKKDWVKIFQENIQKDKWDSLTTKEKENLLLSVHDDKGPDYAEEYSESDWEDIPDNIANSLSSMLNENQTSKEVEDINAHGYDNADKKNLDNQIFDQYLNGLYVELKKDPELTMEKAREIVAKNLASDSLYYMKNAAFKIDGIGYTDEAPGLTPKEITGKYKSSGYGDLKENKLTIPQLSQLKVGDKVKYLGKDTNGFVKGEQYEVSRKESSSTFQPTITIKNKDGKKLRTSNLSKELNESLKEQKLRKVIRSIIKEELNEDHTSNSNDKYEVKYSSTNDTWQVWEGDFLVTDFSTEERAQAYANRKNREQGLKENTEKYFVIRSGGSIGDKEFKKEFDSKEKAIDYAKRMNKQLSPGEKSFYKIKYKVKTELNEYGSSNHYLYEEAIKLAKTLSKEGVVQHVNEIPGSRNEFYEISDWYDNDLTVISFENGREL